MNTRAIALQSLLLVTAIAALSLAVGAVDSEPNDSFDDATPIAAGTHEGVLAISVDVDDYYKFDVAAGHRIEVNFTSPVTDDYLNLCLRNPSRDIVLEVESKGSVSMADAFWTANETGAGIWYIQVWLTTVGGAYSFTLALTGPDDAGAQLDAGATAEGALPVAPGSALAGHLEDLDGSDHFVFTAGSGDVISVDFTSHATAGEMTLYLVDRHGNQLFALRSKDGVKASDAHYTANETEVGSYYLRVELESSPGDYEFVLGLAAQDDAGLLDDAPEAPADSPAILPGLHTGHLEDEDDFDAFRFQAGQGDMITVEFSADAGNDLITLVLADWDEATVLTLESQAGVEQVGAYYTANETAMAWFFLMVVMDTAPGDYTFELVVVRQDDAGSGRDAASAILHGLPLQDGIVVGMLGGLDSADHYYLEVMGGWEVTVNLTNAQDTSMTCGIIGDAGTQVPIGTVASANDQVGTGKWTVPMTVTKGSHWYLKVVAADGFEPGIYRLELFVKETPPDQETPMMTFTDPTGAQNGMPLALTAIVTDNIAVLDVRLFFKIDDEVTWHDVQMNRTTGDNYTATIPGAELDGQTLRFYIIARDTSFNDRSQGSQNSPRLVGIAPADAVPPDLYYKPPSSVVKGKDLAISVEATDNVGVVSVMAYFKIDDEVTWHELALVLDSGFYKGTIPSSSLQGSKLHYYIVAKDAAGGAGSYGTEASPKTLSIKPKDEGPGFAAAAAAAAVVAIAAGLAVTVRGRRR